AFIVATFLGPEFPSIIGGLVGLSIVIPAAKRGFLLPDEPWDFNHVNQTNLKPHHSLSLGVAWIPYLLVAILLVLTRLDFLPIKGWLRSVKI
ncbi:L-lactate permease, partial [Pantoea sp. SIMBA_133]